MSARRRSLAATPCVVLTAWLVATCRLAPDTAVASSVGLSTGWTADACLAAGPDRDADGIDDECELALAKAFAPELVVDPRDCSWDPDAWPAPRLAGGYAFAAQGTRDARTVRIAYMPAYFRDCGWEGLACLTRAAGCSAHAGDSEAVVVEVRYGASARWVAEGVFLSAHCLGRSDGRCRWYHGRALGHFAWARGVPRGAPRVWVAKGKHGNYPSQRECDTGHWYHDSCDGNSAVYRFPVVSSAQNVGSRSRPWPPADVTNPAGCLPASALPLGTAGTDAGTRECFWDASAAFRGWQHADSSGAATPYERILRHAAQF